MLVVSEFVGCSPSVSGAIRVNPWSIDSLADGIYTAIKMPAADRHLRHDKHWRYVSQHTVRFWAQARLSSCSTLLCLSLVGFSWYPAPNLVAASSCSIDGAQGDTPSEQSAVRVCPQIRREKSGENCSLLTEQWILRAAAVPRTRSRDAWAEGDRTGVRGPLGVLLSGWGGSLCKLSCILTLGMH